MSRKNRLVDVQLDPNSLAVANPDVEHERRVAIFDLLEDNEFEIIDGDEGPYILNLSVQEGRLLFDVKHENGANLKVFILSLSPLRRIIRDYLMICESYHHAIRNSTPSQIEAVDMGRRGLHNEGSEILEMRLKDKIKFNFDTARRLFTLVCALHIRL